MSVLLAQLSAEVLEMLCIPLSVIAAVPVDVLDVLVYDKCFFLMATRSPCSHPELSYLVCGALLRHKR